MSYLDAPPAVFSGSLARDRTLGRTLRGLPCNRGSTGRPLVDVHLGVGAIELLITMLHQRLRAQSCYLCLASPEVPP